MDGISSGHRHTVCEVLGLALIPTTSTSIGITSGSALAGMKIDSDSGDGLIDGFLRCSKAMPGGMDCLEEPSFDRMSAASFSARGM